MRCGICIVVLGLLTALSLSCESQDPEVSTLRSKILAVDLRTDVSVRQRALADLSNAEASTERSRDLRDKCVLGHRMLIEAELAQEKANERLEPLRQELRAAAARGGNVEPLIQDLEELEAMAKAAPQDLIRAEELIRQCRHEAVSMYRKSSSDNR